MTRTWAAGPLHPTAGRVGAALSWLDVRVGLPEDAAGWTTCADTDAAFVAGWEPPGGDHRPPLRPHRPDDGGGVLPGLLRRDPRNTWEGRCSG